MIISFSQLNYEFEIVIFCITLRIGMRLSTQKELSAI